VDAVKVEVVNTAPVIVEMGILMKDSVEPNTVEGKDKTHVINELPYKVEYIVVLTVKLDTVMLDSSVVLC
jgi:hypothetical protein